MSVVEPEKLNEHNDESSCQAGYTVAHEHLYDELRRISYLVKAYWVRKQDASPSSHPNTHSVSQFDFRWESLPPSDRLPQAWHDQIDKAERIREHIEKRWKKTPDVDRWNLPVFRLTRLLFEDTYPTTEPKDQRLRLALLQRDVILLALLNYYFPEYRRAFNDLVTDDGTLSGELSVALAAEICQPMLYAGDDPLALFHGDLPLLRNFFVLLGVAELRSSQRPLRIDPAVACFLLEKGPPDPELLGSTVLHHDSLLFEDLILDDALRNGLYKLKTLFKKDKQVLLFHGPAGGPFVDAARAVLSKMRTPRLLVADVAKGANLPNWHEWTTRVARHARLNNAAIMWYGATAIIESARNDHRWRDLIHAPPNTPVFITSDVAWDPDFASCPASSCANSTLFARVEFPVPTVSTRRRLWEQQLFKSELQSPGGDADYVLDLVSSFQFTAGQIADAANLAQGLGCTQDEPGAIHFEHLYDACRRVSARGLISFTQRIPPRRYPLDQRPLDTVVLAPEGKQQLNELNERIQSLNRVYYEYGFGNNLGLGRGLVALFSGPSGTGKTLAATVLASSQGRDLYKVDMAAVVSKYVGETEKNLARVFSDAQSANALLFFDEAESIFGKRGEVDKAQDRWANMEINFLLQRIEEFSGVVILATNHKQHIDEAFLRRVHMLIDFKTPSATDRFRILSAMIPPDVVRPSDGELKHFCERFEVAGGSLKNIAVDAAFRAVQDLSKPVSSVTDGRLHITIKHLLQATAREYRKLSRPVNVSSFGVDYLKLVKEDLFVD